MPARFVVSRNDGKGRDRKEFVCSATNYHDCVPYERARELYYKWKIAENEGKCRAVVMKADYDGFGLS